MNLKELIAVSKATLSEFGKDDVSLLSAALTYFSFFSLFPLMLLGITLAGTMFNPDDARNFIFTTIAQVAPGSTQLLNNALTKAIENRNDAGVVALVSIAALAFTASNAFGTLYKAINRAWNTEHRPGIIMDKVISFLLMALAGSFALATLFFSAVLTSIRAFTQESIGKIPGEQVFFQVLSVLGSVVLTFLVLVIMYWFIPRTKVRFKDIWVAALLVALVWTLVKELFSLYLGSSLQNFDAIYGTLGAVIILLTWIYISSMIILTGAEFAAETQRYRRLNTAAAIVEAKDRQPPDNQGKEPNPWF